MICSFANPPFCQSAWQLLQTVHTVPKIRFMYFQKWNCAASFLIPSFSYLWGIFVFPGSVLFGCSKVGRPTWKYIYRSQTHKCGNSEIEHYNAVLEIMKIMRLRSFISRSTSIGTRHLYLILTGPSFVVHVVARSLMPADIAWRLFLIEMRVLSSPNTLKLQ
jgi:hypothetical protein